MSVEKENVGFLDFVSFENYTYGSIYEIREYLEHDSVLRCIEKVREKMFRESITMDVLYVSHKKSNGYKVLRGKNNQRTVISYINHDNFLYQQRHASYHVFYDCIIFDNCYPECGVQKTHNRRVYISINNNRVIDELAHISKNNKENVVLLDDMTYDELCPKFKERVLHIRLNKNAKDIGYVSPVDLIIVNDVSNLLNFEIPEGMYDRVIMYNSMFPDPRDIDKNKEIEIMRNLPLLKNSQVISCIHPSKIEIVSFLKPKIYIPTGVNLMEINKM